MVSGVPVRNAALHARGQLDELANQGMSGLGVSLERRIPDAWELDWAASTGRDPQAHLEATQHHQDLVMKVQKNEESHLEAIGGANHFQFIAPKQALLKALPSEWTGKLMGSMIELDEAVDDLGYLRLATTARYTRHLGNALSSDVAQEARSLGLLEGEQIQVIPRKARKRPWLLRVPGSRRVLSAVYNRLFAILYR
jgi:hypothetical protein